LFNKYLLIRIPIIASLTPVRNQRIGFDFVFIKNMGLAMLSPRYPYNLAFSFSAPITLVPESLPFARPIPIHEILDVLSKYMTH
jgi:hypothetical protein